MVSRPEGHEVCVVGRRRDGHAACTAYVRVAQLVGQHLQLVRVELIVVPQDVVMRRPACTLWQILNRQRFGELP